MQSIVRSTSSSDRLSGTGVMVSQGYPPRAIRAASRRISSTSEAVTRSGTIRKPSCMKERTCVFVRGFGVSILLGWSLLGTVIVVITILVVRSAGNWELHHIIVEDN